LAIADCGLKNARRDNPQSAIENRQPAIHRWWYLDELVSTEGMPAEAAAATPTGAPAIALREEEANYVAPEEGQGG
jgi:hypothetical protein